MPVLLWILAALPPVWLWLMRPRAPRRSMDAFTGHLYAHRGLWNESRAENTLPAFDEAAAQGFGIELDVRLTRDHRLAVIHDASPDRVITAPGPHPPVGDSTLRELQALPMKQAGCRIPSLDEVLRVTEGRVPLLIELKSGGHNAALCRLVLDTMRTAPHAAPWCVESFDPRILWWFRIHAPQVLRGQLAYGRRGLPPGEERASLPALLLMQTLLGNVLSRPDFIAWDHRTDSLGLRLVRRVWHPCTACWVVRSRQEMDALRHAYDLQIFEGFVPGR